MLCVNLLFGIPLIRPQAITTKGGKMVITMEEILNHNLNFRSGMVQSWNKFCFTTGYIEVSISMPGAPTAPGLWPGTSATCCLSLHHEC